MDSWRSHKCLHQGTLIFAKSPKRREVGRLRKCVPNRHWLNKMHNLKAENYVVLSNVTEDYSPGISLLVSSEELFQREKGGTRIYGSFCWKANKQKPCSKHQKITADHTKTRHLKLMILMLLPNFLVYMHQPRLFFSKIFPLSPTEILIQCVLLMSRN